MPSLDQFRLKLWIKHREYEPDIERLGLNVSRSHRGSNGWTPPRRKSSRH